MTVVPLPASPCVRVRLDYTQGDGTLAGSRFYLSYAGASPTPTYLNTLASDIAAAWESHLAGIVNEQWALTEVDVLDIATDSGASGSWTGSNAGTDSSSGVPTQVANNVEYDIGRRYRGGKPRMFLPPGGDGRLQDQSHWNNTFVTLTGTSVLAFFTEIEALSIGSIGALAHVNLSYYKGFHTVTNSSGRMRSAPTYRDVALVDTITGYAPKALLGSQRRRRTASRY